MLQKQISPGKWLTSEPELPLEESNKYRNLNYVVEISIKWSYEDSIEQTNKLSRYHEYRDAYQNPVGSVLIWIIESKTGIRIEIPDSYSHVWNKEKEDSTFNYLLFQR